MDKLRALLATAKKYHFWLLCGGVIGVGIMIWLTATGSLANKFESRKKLLDGKFDAMQGICGKREHPNQGVVDATHGAINQLKRRVFQSWDHLYRKQKKENPVPAVLKEDFITVFESLGPEDEIPVAYRQRYQNFIELHIPKLFEEIDIVRPKKEQSGEEAAEGTVRPPQPLSAGAGATNPAETEAELIGTVFWDEQDRNKLEKRFNWRQTPSTLEVRLAQEDLWVYEALVRIIRNTNEGCTGNHNAVVKQIKALEIAQDAVASSLLAEGKVVRLPAASTPAAAAAAEPSPLFEEDPQAALAEVPGGGAESDLLAGRYVAPDGKPLAAGEKPPFAEYKIMPICMKLTINQTKIPKLLVECANSSMPIEVRRVRIRPDEGTDALDLSQVAAGDAAAAAAGAHLPVPHHLGAAALPKSLHGGQQAQVSEKDIPIEIHGFIYIYNEPDHEKLGTGAVAEEAATTTVEGPSEAVPAEQPATTPKSPGGTPSGGAGGQGPAGGQPPAAGG